MKIGDIAISPIHTGVVVDMDEQGPAIYWPCLYSAQPGWGSWYTLDDLERYEIKIQSPYEHEVEQILGQQELHHEHIEEIERRSA